MSPVSSATWMNSSGGTMPLPGRRQRTSASCFTTRSDAELDDRLVDGDELVALERALQRRLEAEPSGQLDAHGLVEPLDLAAPALLGAVHRGVGVAEQLDARLDVAAGGGDADRRGDEDLVAADRERRPQLAGDVGGQAGDRRRRSCAARTAR